MRCTACQHLTEQYKVLHPAGEACSRESVCSVVHPVLSYCAKAASMLLPLVMSGLLVVRVARSSHPWQRVDEPAIQERASYGTGSSSSSSSPRCCLCSTLTSTAMGEWLWWTALAITQPHTLMSCVFVVLFPKRWLLLGYPKAVNNL